MIYGFAYVGMIFGIASLWLFLAVLPKPEFIEKPLEDFKNKLRGFIGTKDQFLNAKVNILFDYFLLYQLIKFNLYDQLLKIYTSFSFLIL